MFVEILHLGQLMISVKEAFETILTCVPRLPTETISLLKATGRTLRQPVSADRDLPPYDRVMMDGIAVRIEAFSGEKPVRLRIVGHQPAGSPPQELAHSADCLEIATGAVLPAGADVIVPVEEITIAKGFATVSEDYEPVSGRHVHHRGSDCKAGEQLLSEGMRLGAKEIAVGASCGAVNVQVATVPRVSIVSTGDELVDIVEMPQPHQIRRSNSHSLAAALEASGLGRSELTHFSDEPEMVSRGLEDLLPRMDVLVLSGGVSKGKKDYLPSALEALGIKKRFHWVSQRPGKPLWFGTGPSGQPIFALPGNPLSALICFHRYVAPALEKMAGWTRKTELAFPLAGPYVFKPPLTCFLPVRLKNGSAGLEAIPNPAGNSGDFTGILNTDGFVELPPDETEFETSSLVPFWPWY